MVAFLLAVGAVPDGEGGAEQARAEVVGVQAVHRLVLLGAKAVAGGGGGGVGLRGGVAAGEAGDGLAVGVVAVVGEDFAAGGHDDGDIAAVVVQLIARLALGVDANIFPCSLHRSRYYYDFVNYQNYGF